MPTYSDTKIDLVINKPTQSQFDSAVGLDPTEVYFVDPQFTGNKLLQTSANGDIVESDESPLTIQALAATDSITLADNYCYQGGEQTSLTIALPSTATVGFVAQITFKSGNVQTTLSFPETNFIWNKRGDDVVDGVLVPTANKEYMIIITYNGFSFVGYSSCV